jgi:ADP-heptose:LPS heptosyltransferase
MAEHDVFEPVVARLHANDPAGALALLDAMPPSADVQLIRSWCLMTLGRFREAFAAHEWRACSPLLACTPLPRPPVRPSLAELAGRRVFVVGESGFGDTIMYARYCAPLAHAGAHVTLAVSEPLRRLTRGFKGVAAAATAPPTRVKATWLPGFGWRGVPCFDGDPPPPEGYDKALPLLALPVIVGGDPLADPYLTLDPMLQFSWETRLRSISRPAIGLVWRGNPGHPNDANRSMPLAALRPLVESANATWISLQIPSAKDEIAALGLEKRLLDLPGCGLPYCRLINDFADTAAVIDQLDLVVSVDTAVAHLAGALGRECWLLLPWRAEARWGVSGDQTPWYPAHHLFRQPKPGDWAAVVNDVIDALAGWKAGSARAPGSLQERDLAKGLVD